MTTVIIDCDAQKVYADKCMSQTRFGAREKNLFGVLTSSETLSYEACVHRDNDYTKVAKSGSRVIVGSGNADLLRLFSEVYPQVERVGMRGRDHCHSEIYVVEWRKEGLLIDEYNTLFQKATMFHRAETILTHTSYCKRTGQIFSGSGGTIALGLMLGGMKAKDVIPAVSTVDPHTNSEFDVIDLKELYFSKQCESIEP